MKTLKTTRIGNYGVPVRTKGKRLTLAGFTYRTFRREATGDYGFWTAVFYAPIEGKGKILGRSILTSLQGIDSIG